MLVLARKRGESIEIGAGITVTVVEVRDGVARLGIDAPKEIPVHRKEVADLIRRKERLNHES